MKGVLEERLARWKDMIESRLDELIPVAGTFPQPLFEAMRYSLFAGGKRIRPAFVFAAAETVGGSAASAVPFAAAIEMIHTYSLIHDDLPAMDDDELRRGKPTNHVLYGEGVAILAGDALLTDAFALLARPEVTGHLPASLVLRAVGEIARAAGSAGMVGGQTLDLVSEGKEIDLPSLEYLHTHKTGAMIRAATMVGGLVGGGEEQAIRTLVTYAERVGLAFQIADDVLDVEGSTQMLGKPVGSDEQLSKATYPALMGMAESKRRALELMESAIEGLAPFGEAGDALAALARFVVERQN